MELETVCCEERIEGVTQLDVSSNNLHNVENLQSIHSLTDSEDLGNGIDHLQKSKPESNNLANEMDGLSEVLNAIKGEKSKFEKFESLDNHIKKEDITLLKKEDIFGDFIFTETSSKDYSQLFSYLDTGIKENPYTEYQGEIGKEKYIVREELKKTMGHDKVADIIRDASLLNIFGMKQELDNETKDRFEDYKMFNLGFNMVLYRMLNS